MLTSWAPLAKNIKNIELKHRLLSLNKVLENASIFFYFKSNIPEDIVFSSSSYKENYDTSSDQLSLS